MLEAFWVTRTTDFAPIPIRLNSNLLIAKSKFQPGYDNVYNGAEFLNSHIICVESLVLNIFEVKGALGSWSSNINILLLILEQGSSTFCSAMIKN